jgi:UDP-glucose 4-epimerase
MSSQRVASTARAPELARAYDRKSVLVTGGLGFIGSNLVHRLASESSAEIRVVDSLNPMSGGDRENLSEVSRNVELHVLDLASSARLREIVRGIDVVFNLAGQISHIDSMTDPLRDLRANSEAQLALLEVCRECNPGVRIVYSSTRQVYGPARSLPVDETHPVAPIDVNGINKYSAESFHQLYYRIHGIETCLLRLTNTYGPRLLLRQARQGFIGCFIGKILDGEEVTLFGDGEQIRDLNYVECVIDAFLLAGVHPRAPGRVYNLGSGEPIALLDLVRMMIDIAGHGSYRMAPFPQDRQRIDIGNFYSDFSRIRNELGWRPRVSLREGLAQTLEFFEGRRTLYSQASGQ